MNVPEVRLGPITLKLCIGWFDVTHEIDGDTPPLSLAKSDGVGIFQITVAEYFSGQRPSIGVSDLRKMLEDFSEQHALKSLDLPKENHRGLFCYVAQSFAHGQGVTRVWYWSDGANIIFATYTCDQSIDDRELSDCEAMVSTMKLG